MDWRVATAIVVATLTLTLDHYNALFTQRVFDHLLFHLLVPLLTILLVFRESPAQYGMQLGDWRAGLLLTGIGCAGVTVIILGLARQGAFQRYYAPLAASSMPLPLHTALELLGWEFLFRGFLLFALYRVCGPYALILQAVPFTIAHFGKPQLETLSCIFGGTVFGYIAWRTRSFLYPFLIHWYQLLLLIYLTGGG
jgi:membrane protease YdiL (CAAX protease family)